MTLNERAEKLLREAQGLLLALQHYKAMKDAMEERERQRQAKKSKLTKFIEKFLP